MTLCVCVHVCMCVHVHMCSCDLQRMYKAIKCDSRPGALGSGSLKPASSRTHSRSTYSRVPATLVADSGSLFIWRCGFSSAWLFISSPTSATLFTRRGPDFVTPSGRSHIIVHIALCCHGFPRFVKYYLPIGLYVSVPSSRQNVVGIFY